MQDKMGRWIETLLGLAALGVLIQKRISWSDGTIPVPDFAAMDHLTAEDWASYDQELGILIEQRNDRGVAVMCLAMLEDRLRWSIEQCFVRDLPKDDKDRLFEGMGALATYASKVRMAFALGLINKMAKKEFLLLGKIRNKFAHEFRRLTFFDPQIVSLCKGLDVQELEGDELNRYALCSFIGMITLLATGGAKGQARSRPT